MSPRTATLACRSGLAACLALALSAPVHAEFLPYAVGGSHNIRRENNVLRLSEGEAAPVGSSRSDTVSTTALFANFDQPFGRQRGRASVTLRKTGYDANRQYDNQGYSLSGGLDWATVSEVSGSLSASASRSLSAFNLQGIGLLQEKNMESARSFDAVVRMGVTAQHAVELAAGSFKVGNSLDRVDVQAREFEQDTTALSLRWRPRSASNFGVGLRQANGRYPKFRSTPGGFEAEHFSRHDIDLSASVSPTGASTLDLLLSWGKTRYQFDSQRSIEGVAGAIGWAWQPGGRLSLSTRLARDTGQESLVRQFLGQPAPLDYSRVNDSLRFSAGWELTAKLALSLSYIKTKREVVQTSTGSLGDSTLRDTENGSTYTLGLRWTPARSLAFGCDHNRDRRGGAGVLITPRVVAGSFGCWGQLTLQ